MDDEKKEGMPEWAKSLQSAIEALTEKLSPAQEPEAAETVEKVKIPEPPQPEPEQEPEILEPEQEPEKPKKKSLLNWLF